MQTLFSRFREQTLSSVQAESSVLAYNSRFVHLEPLAKARFKKDSVGHWLENVRKTRSKNSARELVRLAKKFWEFGMQLGAWPVKSNPFCTTSSAKMIEGGGLSYYSTSLNYKYIYAEQIQKILNLAPNPETQAFWACCALAGLRQSEAANLVWKQISGAKIVDLPARGNAPTSVEIGSNLLEFLQNYCHYIKQRSNSIPYTPTHIFPNLPKHASQRTRELQNVAGNSVSFNLLRYSFGANLLLQGASLETVRQKMRFSRLEDLVAVYDGLLKSKNFLAGNVKDYNDICDNGGAR